MANAADQLTDLRAFEIRKDYEDLTAAQFSYDDGRTFDVMAALGEKNEYGPKGAIVVDAVTNPGLAEQLVQREYLKAAKVPESLQTAATADAERRAEETAQTLPEPTGIDSINAQQEFLRSGQTPDGAPAADAPANES